MGNEITKLQDEIEALNKSVDEYAAGVQAADIALTATIADLRSQLVQGPPGLTADQGDAFAVQIAAIKAKLVVAGTSVTGSGNAV